MEPHIFKIKKSFLLPFTLLVALLLMLLTLSVSQGQSWEKTVLAFSFLGTLLVCLEAAKRTMAVSPEGLVIKKFFRVKSIPWTDITQLAVVPLGSKAYFLLTTTRGFYFFSNMYENHALLIRLIVDKLDIEKVEIEVKHYLDHPVERRSLIVISWVAVFMIAAFIFLKLWSA